MKLTYIEFVDPYQAESPIYRNRRYHANMTSRILVLLYYVGDKSHLSILKRKWAKKGFTIKPAFYHTGYLCHTYPVQTVTGFAVWLMIVVIRQASWLATR